MANALEVQYREKGAEAIYEVCDAMLAQERQALQRRKSAGDPSVWDRHREARLAEVPTTKSLQRQTHEALSRICEVLLEDPQTKQIFTVGILRDVVLSCVYAQAGKDFEALGEQIADKVLHQLQGTPKVLEVVSELCRDLPNAGEIRALATRMGAFGGERRIRPLLLGVCA